MGVVTSLTFQAYGVSAYTGGVIVLTDDDNCTNTRWVDHCPKKASCSEQVCLASSDLLYTHLALAGTLFVFIVVITPSMAV